MNVKKLIRKIRLRVCGCKLVVVAVQDNHVLVRDQNKNVGCLEGDLSSEVMCVGTVVWALPGKEKSVVVANHGSYKNKDCVARLIYYDELRQVWIASLKYDGSLLFFDSKKGRFSCRDMVVLDYTGKNASLSCYTV